MKFFTLLSTALLALPSIITAAPTPDDTCPSVQTIQDWIKSNAAVGANTVFYTAGAKQAQAATFAATLDGGQYWGKVFGVKYLDWLDECGSGAAQDKLFPRMGEALAKQSTGEAYVLMSKGRPIADFWKNYEYPSLKDRVKVTAVNADDFGDKKDYNEQPF